MKFTLNALVYTAAIIIAFTGVTLDAYANNNKIGNNSLCTLTVIVGVTDGITTWALPAFTLAPNAGYYPCLNPGEWIYKINIDGVSYVPPAPGVCTPLLTSCGIELCGDSIVSWFVN